MVQREAEKSANVGVSNPTPFSPMSSIQPFKPGWQGDHMDMVQPTTTTFVSRNRNG